MQADPDQRNGDTMSSSPDSSSLSGDGKRSGKSRRRRKRSAHPQSCPGALEGKDQDPEGLVQDDCPNPDYNTVLLGLRSECSSVWFDHGVYEQAESFYQCWLANFTNGQMQPNGSLLPTENLSTQEPCASLSLPAGGYAEYVACHQVVQNVWVNKPSFDKAERSFAESRQSSVPNTLALPPSRPATASTPDEGYLSLAPTPATPTQQAAGVPNPSQPINGLPRISMELHRDVWLEKPLFDRAEAAFYQNLYGNNNLGTSNTRVCNPKSLSTSRSSDHHPRSPVQEEEEKQWPVPVPQGKADVFHALHPIQEEEEPVEGSKEEDSVSKGRYFLHPDSERVWLDKWRYEAAEDQFHAVVEWADGHRDTGPPAPSPDTRSSPLGEKYDQPQESWHFPPKAHSFAHSSFSAV